MVGSLNSSRKNGNFYEVSQMSSCFAEMRVEPGYNLKHNKVERTLSCIELEGLKGWRV